MYVYPQQCLCAYACVCVCVYKSAASSFRVEWPPKKVFVFFFVDFRLLLWVGRSFGWFWVREGERERAVVENKTSDWEWASGWVRTCVRAQRNVHIVTQCVVRARVCCSVRCPSRPSTNSPFATPTKSIFEWLSKCFWLSVCVRSVSTCRNHNSCCCCHCFWLWKDCLLAPFLPPAPHDYFVFTLHFLSFLCIYLNFIIIIYFGKCFLSTVEANIRIIFVYVHTSTHTYTPSRLVVSMTALIPTHFDKISKSR